MPTRMRQSTSGICESLSRPGPLWSSDRWGCQRSPKERPVVARRSSARCCHLAVANAWWMSRGAEGASRPPRNRGRRGDARCCTQGRKHWQTASVPKWLRCWSSLPSPPSAPLQSARRLSPTTARPGVFSRNSASRSRGWTHPRSTRAVTSAVSRAGAFTGGLASHRGPPNHRLERTGSTPAAERDRWTAYDMTAMRYDWAVAPDPDEWLAATESDRMAAVQRYHQRAQHDTGNPRLHAAIHVTVETQLAERHPAATDSLRRLVAEGLRRHDALHAIGSVVAEEMSDMLTSRRTHDPDVYSRKLQQLTAAVWRTGGEE